MDACWFVGQVTTKKWTASRTKSGERAASTSSTWPAASEWLPSTRPASAGRKGWPSTSRCWLLAASSRPWPSRPSCLTGIFFFTRIETLNFCIDVCLFMTVLYPGFTAKSFTYCPKNEHEVSNRNVFPLFLLGLVRVFKFQNKSWVVS